MKLSPDFYAFSGLVITIITVLSGFLTWHFRKRNDWIHALIKQSLYDHNIDEKAHLAAIKVIGEIMSKHNDDPQAHPSHHVSVEFTALQLSLAKTLTTIDNKLDSLATEVAKLTDAHNEAVKEGLCFYQQVAKINMTALAEKSNTRKQKAESQDFALSQLEDVADERD